MNMEKKNCLICINIIRSFISVCALVKNSSSPNFPDWGFFMALRPRNFFLSPKNVRILIKGVLKPLKSAIFSVCRLLFGEVSNRTHEVNNTNIGKLNIQVISFIHIVCIKKPHMGLCIVLC